MRDKPTAIRVVPALVVLFVCAAAAPGMARAAIEGNHWFPIGPAPGRFNDFPGGVAGRISAIDVNPADPNEIWVGTAWGGVWHTFNRGLHWTPLTDNMPSLSIGSLVVADCDANGCGRIYAGTGENAIRRDTYYGGGLMVGTINKQTQQVTWSWKNGYPGNYFSRASIQDIVLDPTTSGDSQRIFVILSSGVTAASTHSTVTAPEPSLYGYRIYRSNDNGTTWAKLAVPYSLGYKPTDLKMDPQNSQVLFAGFMGRGIFVSADGGGRWCPMNPGVPKPTSYFCPNYQGLPDVTTTTFDHVEIAIPWGNHHILYASFGHCPDPLLKECRPSIYRSINFGYTWNLMYQGTESSLGGGYCPSAYSRYTHALTVDYTDPDTLFLGGIHLCKSTTWGTAPWVQADTNVLSGVTHYDHRAVLFHPNIAFSNFVYDLNDGGIAISTDSGSTWKPANGNMQTFGLQSVATSPHTARIIGGAQDNAGQMWTGFGAWQHLPCCGDGGFSVMDWNDPNKMYLTSNNGAQHADATPVRTTDKGITFNYGSIPSGLDTTEPRSFYPPLVQDTRWPPYSLYFGTNRLFKSIDDSTNWTPISPVLSTVPNTEIPAKQDVITAIAVAPSDPNWIYVGYYSGAVYKTFGACADACPGPTCCWEERHFLLPAAPITSLAVDPTAPATVYATLGGFAPGNHAWKTTNGGFSWAPTDLPGSLNGVPANWIAVEPGATNRIWLATDRGIHKSTNWGAGWLSFSNGMPASVPVYQIAFDTTRQRVFAATHGRGVYMLSKPTVGTWTGWLNGILYNTRVYGQAFQPNHPTCTMKLLRQDSTVCAEGTSDANGGTLSTDAQGRLVTSHNLYYNNKPMAYACSGPTCVGNTPKSQCTLPGNGLAAVMVICGQQVGIGGVVYAPPVGNPPSSWMSLTGQSGFTVAEDKQPPVEGKTVGSFEVIPTLQTSDGSTRALCTVTVSFMPSETQRQILERARDAINSDGACASSGVTAAVFAGRTTFESEDLFPSRDNLTLTAPSMTGSQLVGAVRAVAGQATGLCFKTNRLGDPIADQDNPMRIHFETGPGGAAGGEIVLKQESGLGHCTIRVPTASGQTAAGIAAAVEEAFQTEGIPGPHPDCPSDTNPRGAVRRGDGVDFSVADDLEICAEDTGIGFVLAPREICSSDADCDDGNPCTADTCDAATRQCRRVNLPDGTICDDGDACTIGGTCLAGACGVPLSCNDGDPCTENVCDPAGGTGGPTCLNPPVQCDDGNVCTRDSCSAVAGGGCEFVPMTGEDCDDGDACTLGDVCVEDPGGTGAVTCQGGSACDDGNACTEDRCEPFTGACSYPPLNCDDGDQCSTDSCSLGVCQSAVVFDIPCDDGDACSTAERCTDDGAGAAACLGGVPPNCDDADACTIDTCDPDTGACGHAGSPVSAVSDLHFISSTTMTWMPPPVVTGSSNTYRGTITAALMVGRTFVYDHVCFEQGDAAGDGADISTDMTALSPGEAYYYIVSYTSSCAESAPCFDSNGFACPIQDPCGTIPSGAAQSPLRPDARSTPQSTPLRGAS